MIVCRLVSALLLCAVAVSEGLKVEFIKTQICPSNAALAQMRKMQGVKDDRACLVECAAQSNCSVMFRSSPSGDCYFGSPEQLGALFNSTNIAVPSECVSHVRNSTIAAGSGSAVSGLNSSLMSKLVILLDFRKGYLNQVNSSKYSATPHGAVFRTGLGVNFTGGNNSDYIEVDTGNRTLASTYLSIKKSFTIYARLLRRDYNHQTYHYFYDCSSAPAASRGEFRDEGGRLRIVHAFPTASSQVLRESIENVLVNNDQFQLASAAVLFVNGSLTNFFNNGSFLTQPNVQSSDYSGEPQCLRLGYHNDPTYALRGLFICYAVAKEALSLN